MTCSWLTSSSTALAIGGAAMPDATQALLLAEVQQLKADVQTLLQRVPSHERKWISPTELSQRAG